MLPRTKATMRVQAREKERAAEAKAQEELQKDPCYAQYLAMQRMQQMQMQQQQAQQPRAPPGGYRPHINLEGTNRRVRDRNAGVITAKEAEEAFQRNEDFGRKFRFVFVAIV